MHRYLCYCRPMLRVATVLILTTDAFVCKRSIRRAGPVAATTEPSSLAPVLSPSADRPERWDSACVANPVVLKPAPGENWKMWYYGNNGNWSDGTVGFLPTGTSGNAPGRRCGRRRARPPRRGIATSQSSGAGCFMCLRVGFNLYYHYGCAPGRPRTRRPSGVIGIHLYRRGGP